MIRCCKTLGAVGVFIFLEGEEGGRGTSCHNKEEEDKGRDRGSQGPQDQEEGGGRAAAMALVMGLCLRLRRDVSGLCN